MLIVLVSNHLYALTINQQFSRHLYLKILFWLQVFDVGESRSMPTDFPEEGSGMWSRFVLAAGLSDAVSRTITAPIDRLKIQLQVRSKMSFHQCQIM